VEILFTILEFILMGCKNGIVEILFTILEFILMGCNFFIIIKKQLLRREG
jgi:hypothetical protein